jgi:hypothetical protein
MITFNCPECGKEINAPDRLAGEEDTCPHCQKTIRFSPIAVDPNAAAADQAGGAGRSGRTREPVKAGPFVQVLMITAVIVMVLGACYVWLFQGDTPARRHGIRPGLSTTQVTTHPAATRPTSGPERAP